MLAVTKSPELTTFISYILLSAILVGYYLFARYKKHEFRLPIGLFLCLFLTNAAIVVVGHYDLRSAVSSLETISTAFLAMAILRFFVFIVVDYLMRYKKLAPVPLITRDIGLIVLYAIIILLILRYKANVDLTSLITTSAVLTAIIGLALQDTLGNLFAGIVLQMEKPYHIGDWVCFDTYTGRVVGMTWKSTRVITRENEMVTIPNNVIAKSHILNYSQPDPTHIATLDIGTSYSDPPNNVREAILSTIAEHPSVARVPSPEIRVKKYNDFSVDYQVRFFLSDFENEERIKSHILNQIWYRFRRDGITIPFPIRTIQQVTPNPEKEETEKNNKTKTAHTVLKNIDIFSPLTDEDFAKLALRVRFETFSSDEVIIQEAASGKSMYVILRGECNVTIKQGGYAEHTVATLKENQFFGEMSLLTGEPRTATVRAKTDIVTLRIEKEDIEDIMNTHPAVATSMSEILAARKEDLAAQKEGLAKDVKKEKNMAAELLKKIKTFFHI